MHPKLFRNLLLSYSALKMAITDFCRILPLFQTVWHHIPEGCNVYGSGSQSVLYGSQGIREQFPGDLWIHFYSGYFKVYLFYLLKEQCFVKIIMELV
jgi:hypothetical protein